MDSDGGNLGRCKEQSVTKQPFTLKEAGCQNSMVGILNRVYGPPGGLWEADVAVVTLLGPRAADQTSSSYPATWKLLPGSSLSQPPDAQSCSAHKSVVEEWRREESLEHLEDNTVKPSQVWVRFFRVRSREIIRHPKTWNVTPASWVREQSEMLGSCCTDQGALDACKRGDTDLHPELGRCLEWAARRWEPNTGSSLQSLNTWPHGLWYGPLCE